jgi:hypothetical protein
VPGFYATSLEEENPHEAEFRRIQVTPTMQEHNMANRAWKG